MDVIGTAHRCSYGQDMVRFDALSDSAFHITKLIEGKEKTAIICIGQANIDKCLVEYELSKKINVVFIKEVTEILTQEGFQVIYFSTDNVFDGRKGNYSEQSKTCAINNYGKMKEEIEHFLLDKYPDVCTFRLPKVLGTQRERQNILTDFENRAEDGEICCIKGNIMSIISKKDIYRACLIASARRMYGIYNLSSGEVYSRKGLAVKFLSKLGVCPEKVIEMELKEFNFKDARPLNISLDNSKFRCETGYEFETVDMLIKQYNKE